MDRSGLRSYGFRLLRELSEQAVLTGIREGRNRPHRHLWGRFGAVIHPSAARDQPLEIELRVLAGHPLDEIEAWFVPSGQDVRNARAGDPDGVGELGLADISAARNCWRRTFMILNDLFTKVTLICDISNSYKW